MNFDPQQFDINATAQEQVAESTDVKKLNDGDCKNTNLIISRQKYGNITTGPLSLRVWGRSNLQSDHSIHANMEYIGLMVDIYGHGRQGHEVIGHEEVVVRILIFLCYLASNGFQSLIADAFGVCQKTVSTVVTTVLNAMNYPDIVARFLKFLPDSPEWCADRASEFSRKCGLSSKFMFSSNFESFRSKYDHSDVVGAVNGCLIKIQQPSMFGWQYYSRKACTVINMISIVDARGRFLPINCEYPGSCHDPSIWRRSETCRIFESGQAVPGFLLIGDAGFANSVSIMTPYRRRAAQQDVRKAHFNEELTEGRVVVEQAFGALKRRFGILEYTARIEPPKVQQIILAACVILYNTAIEVGAQDGQPLSSIRLADVPHSPPGVDPRDFLTRHFYAEKRYETDKITLLNMQHTSCSLKFFEDEARSLSSKEKENLSVIYHHSSLIHVKSDRGSTTYEGHVSRADLPIVFDYFLYPNQRWAKFSRIPAARTPADATGFAALVNQAALLQQVSGGGINLHASTAFAALFNSVMQVPQQNVLRVIGRGS
ncbi:hypothetical protein ANCCEY_12379 [Ancylostoma ceylanicum]|uniref:DDE Tnp4 domain-containing protein n=1 Tax=Ancylostoma ceylanicum TaxID=53326 RepID=A0A0D6L9D4_9BILA|nr:hypothetical protein ANCCEY_12379 [Ancylostoma ceylanicum]